MMAEACATGHPVYLYDTGEGVNSMRFYWERGEKAEGHKGWRRFHRYTMKAFIYRQGMKWGPTRWTRDIRIVQQRLVESGRAAWLGSGTPDADAPPLRDVANAVDRVRALFELPPLAEHNRARAGAL
jgi:hypothetical protein